MCPAGPQGQVLCAGTPGGRELSGQPVCGSPSWSGRPTSVRSLHKRDAPHLHETGQCVSLPKWDISGHLTWKGQLSRVTATWVGTQSSL